MDGAFFNRAIKQIASYILTAFPWVLLDKAMIHWLLRAPAAPHLTSRTESQSRLHPLLLGAIKSARDYLECGGATPLSPGDSAVGKADDDPEGSQPLAGGFAKRYPGSG